MKFFKNSRLWLGSAALVVGLWVLFTAVQEDSFAFYYLPKEVLKEPQRFGAETIRVAGLVQLGSVTWNTEQSTLRFQITDNGIDFLPVRFKGAKPDLFRENQGVIAEGTVNGDTLVAQRLLVKHSEEYKVGEHELDQQEYYRSLLEQ